MEKPTDKVSNPVVVVDLEDYSSKGIEPPKGASYRVRVDKVHIVFENQFVAGREILTRSGKTPPERFRLDQKMRGGATKKIELNEVVDLATPGLERFMTLPLDQTEG